jgi:hypothetical protein
MDATPWNPDSDSTRGGKLPGGHRPGFGRESASALGQKWSALHDAATVVGTIAGVGDAPLRPEVLEFPLRMGDAGGWRRDLAEQGIEDLTAIMEPGLSALLAVHSRGASAVAPAHALWHEFIAARDALLTLVPPPTE